MANISRKNVVSINAEELSAIVQKHFDLPEAAVKGRWTDSTVIDASAIEYFELAFESEGELEA